MTEVDKLVKLEDLRLQLVEASKTVLDACEGKVFPADALFAASNDRALQLLDGFIVLMKADNYTCSITLLRLQLDTVLRISGVFRTKDVHETASILMHGQQLNKIKDKYGKPLRDAYLVELISEQNLWIKRVYALTSSYIHLSSSSFFHLIKKTKSIDDSSKKLFFMSSTSEEIDGKHKQELISAFEVVTRAVIKLSMEWAETRLNYGSIASLEKRFTSSFSK